MIIISITNKKTLFSNFIKMKDAITILIYLQLATLIEVQSASTKITKTLCNGTLFIDNKYYTPQTLKTISGIPADISINWNSGTIYFTLINDKMGLYAIKRDGSMINIKSEGIGQIATIDNINNIVYVGTNLGVHTYNEKLNKVQEKIVAEDVMFMDVFKEDLYLTTWPNNIVLKFNAKSKTSQMITSIQNAHGATLDDIGNIYYDSKEGTGPKQVLRATQTMPTVLSGFKIDTRIDFFKGNDGVMYAIDADSNWYKIDPNAAQASLLGSFELPVNTFGIDAEGNVVIGTNNRIVKYFVSERNPCSKKDN